jgi:hypothetical protein
MANNRKMTNGRRRQIIMSAPSKLFVEKYLTKKGIIMLRTAKTKSDKAAVWAKYGKNRYRPNPESKPVKGIFHRVLRSAEPFSLKEIADGTETI